MSTTTIVTIITALGSIAGLIYWILKRFYGPPPNSQKIYKLRKKLRQSRVDIANELEKIKNTSALKRDYTHYNELLGQRDALLEELDLLQKS